MFLTDDISNHQTEFLSQTIITPFIIAGFLILPENVDVQTLGTHYLVVFKKGFCVKDKK